MSLLLDALKKAERAKQEAQRKAEESSAPPPQGDLRIADDATQEAPVRTRDQLPDISQSLQIESDDIGPARRQQAESPPLELEPAAPPPRTAQSAARAEASAAQSSERAAAKKVFEAKFKEPNPRLPFYITLGVLGAFALGTVGYFWYQLRPPPALVNTNPPPPSGEQTIVAAAAARPAPSATTAPAAPAQAEVPGLPPAPASTPAPAAAAPAAAAPTAPAAAAPAARPARASPARRAARAPRASEAPARPSGTELLRRDDRVAVKHPAPQIDPHVAAGYAAYQAGNVAAAREAYRKALADDPRNRDALLGMAAVEMRSGRFEDADQLYRRLLEADPRDPHAQAGLLALRSDLTDPVAAESRVKTLLAEDPGATVLYFTLGNEYARQGRWAEAQQAYFKAYSADSENPDYAYNVAVSLDHLRQPKLALEYYRRALALAAKRSASFDQTAARQRAQALGG
jgi:tetratricopeptide (TPR) repeat protein